MRLDVIVGMGLLVACSSGTQQGERSARAPVVSDTAEREAEPEAAPAVDTTAETATPTAEPAAAPLPAPGGLASLAAALDAAGVQRITRVEGVIFHGLAERPHTTVTWVKEAAGAWVCIERANVEPICLELPADAEPGSPFGTHQGDIHLGWGSRERGRNTVVVSASGGVTATHRAPGAARDAETPATAPSTRAAPPLLPVLAGVEITMFTDEAVAVAGGRLMSCRFAAGLSCGDPIEVAALARENTDVRGLTCIYDPLCTVDVEYRTPNELGGENGAGVLVLAVDPETQATTLVLTAINDVVRETRASADSEASEEIEIEAGDFDLTSADCLQVGASRGNRLTISESGSERRSPHRLRRAPATVPPEGVDPFTTSLEGTWTVVRTGGLQRRSGRCPDSY
jgi:hypothetical protein